MEDLNELQEDKKTSSAQQKSKKRRLSLKDGEFSPSSVTWLDLQRVGIVSSFDTFSLYLTHQPPDYVDDCNKQTIAYVDNYQALIREAIQPLNEQFPLLILSAMISHIVIELNEKIGKVVYKGRVEPVVFHNEDDSRKDKKSDYAILKIVNRRTVLVVEIKSGIGTELYSVKTELAQLFLEVHYSMQDCKESNIVCVLTDTSSYHIFVLNLEHTPYLVEKYHYLRDPSSTNLCSLLRLLIVNLSA